jgi:hypothetical protein
LDLFPELLPPRAQPRVLMHVFDAGTAHCGRAEDLGKPICRMACCRHRCQVQSAWLVFDTISEARRGIACPKCNPPGTPGMLDADHLERQDLDGKPPAGLSP